MRIFLSFLALLLVSVSLFARDIEIFVEDMDLAWPLEGALIRLPDGRRYFAGPDGTAVFSIPDGAQLLIQISYPGYDTVRLVIAPGQNRHEVRLRLSGVMEGRELVVEAARPGGGGETVTARSVAVERREIAQTAEIGIVEDIMSTIRLLPGVGYTGMFNAQPSIRGGDPGDMRASLDGFYIFNPFHWGGGFSIFDPRMVESAQLSHGVFSTRYGHTISGLLDIRSQTPSFTETKIEIGASSSAASFALSFPLAGRGGIMLMGRVTYYDPIFGLARALSGVYQPLEIVNSIRQAPFIRSGTLTGNYRFSHNLEFSGTAFWGTDGVGASFDYTSYWFNPVLERDELDLRIDANLDYTNHQGFFTGALSWNPRNDMLLRFSAGAGYMNMAIDGAIEIDRFDDTIWGGLGGIESTRNTVRQSESMFNVQGRVDFDWDLGRGFLFAAGVQEKFSRYRQEGLQNVRWQRWLSQLPPDVQAELITAMSESLGDIPLDLETILGIFGGRNNIMVSFPAQHEPDADNTVFATSAYVLTEYRSPDGRFEAELGLRIDHFHVSGRGFSLGTIPVLNPRLNVSRNLFRNRGIIESMSVAAGTGLFSSMNNAIFFAEKHYEIDNLRPNRSWSSVIGTNIQFREGISLNIEAYYRHIFNRMYVPVNVSPERAPEIRPNFDGIGRVWGIDVMLRRVQSRMIDGWLSYSFNWTRLRDPGGDAAATGISGGTRGGDWYFPSYHRFHNMNLVLNIRPAPRFNIYTRVGLASGVQIPRRIGDVPIVFPVFVHTPGETGYFAMRYFWPSELDENNRTTASLPVDIKFSLFGRNQSGRARARWEVYFAVENVLGLLSSQLGLSQGNASFNNSTGEVSDGAFAATYQIPIPIPSIGFRITF